MSAKQTSASVGTLHRRPEPQCLRHRSFAPGIFVIRASVEEGDIADVVPGSAAKVAVLANNVNAVAKSTSFIGFYPSTV
jgi:hypothetical protein